MFPLADLHDQQEISGSIVNLGIAKILHFHNQVEFAKILHFHNQAESNIGFCMVTTCQCSIGYVAPGEIQKVKIMLSLSLTIVGLDCSSSRRMLAGL